MKSIQLRFIALAVSVLSACGGGGGGATTPGAAPNAVPEANAGQIQNVIAGNVVTLDGSKSIDANGDPLTYRWTLTSKPVGSSAALTLSTTARPNFTADITGDYVATLIVNDGKVDSTSTAVTVTATHANAAPVANAGTTQNVTIGSTVTLDGSASSDANGDPLTYRWTLTSKPTGSSAALTAAGTSARPSFLAEMGGAYVATLIVNDGQVDSASTTVTVTATRANAAPVANAGITQNVTVGATVSLDGSASSDANGDALTYRWMLTSKPVGSTAALTLSTSSRPSFMADITGVYVATLIVNDGQIDSSSTTVTVTATRANATPIANAGSAQYTATGSTVTLDGSSSTDANGDRLTYRWTLTTKPSGSVAILSSASAVQTTFRADITGTYVLTLIVNDGQVDSIPANVSVTAEIPPMPTVVQGKLYISNWPTSAAFSEVDLTTGILKNQADLSCPGIIAATVGPDGVAIGATTDSRVVKFDPVSGRCDTYFSAPELLDAIAVATDGTIVAQSNATFFGAKQIYRFNFAGGILGKVPLSGVTSVGGLAVGPNGSVYGPGFGGLYKLDTQFGSASYVGPTSQIPLSEVCINRNGNLFGHSFGVLYKYQYLTGGLTSQLTLQRDLGLGAIVCR